jgi:hypothetical protein
MTWRLQVRSCVLSCVAIAVAVAVAVAVAAAVKAGWVLLRRTDGRADGAGIAAATAALKAPSDDVEAAGAQLRIELFRVLCIVCC